MQAEYVPYLRLACHLPSSCSPLLCRRHRSPLRQPLRARCFTSARRFGLGPLLQNLLLGFRSPDTNRLRGFGLLHNLLHDLLHRSTASQFACRLSCSCLARTRTGRSALSCI